MEPEVKPPETIDEENENVSDEDYEKDNDEIESETIEKLYEDYKSQIDSISKTLDKLNQTLDLTLEQRMFFDDFETRYSRPEKEVLTKIDERLSQLEKQADKEKGEIGDQKRTNRERTRKRIILLFAGVSIVGAVIYFFVKLNADKQPQASGDFTQQDADDAEKLIQKWRDLPDDQFWEQVATYVDGYNPSLQAQMLMMGYAKNWAKDSQFEIDGSDKYDLIEQLESAYATNNKCSDIYRTVEKMTYKGAAAPRMNAADLCELALADISAQAQQDSSGGGGQ